MNILFIMKWTFVAKSRAFIPGIFGKSNLENLEKSGNFMEAKCYEPCNCYFDFV
jgi:hypothetical protein